MVHITWAQWVRLQFKCWMDQRGSWCRTDFIFQNQLGSGQFGVVFAATEKESSRQVAIKIITKNKISSPTLHQRLKREVEIHSRLNYQYICRLFGYFDDSHHVYLVMEFCSKGNLYTPIKKCRQFLATKKIASILRQLLLAVSYLELRNVMHRDIKLENILFDADYNVKLTDFGCCVHTTSTRRTVCGTVEYLCPQMVNSEVYDHSVDLYCLGIVAYELFYYQSPFYDAQENQIVKNIREGVIIFDEEIRAVPEPAKCFITELLKNEKKHKPNYFLNHEFLREYADPDPTQCPSTAGI